MKLVTVQSYPNAAEAHAARAVLEAGGLRSTIADESTATTLWHIGAIGGIKLQVTAEDLVQSRELLGTPLAADLPEWQCPACLQHVDPGFEVCWSCGLERPAEVPSNLEPADLHAPNEEAEQTVDRAWRAAVIGILFLPGILHLYSLWVLLGGDLAADPLSPSLRRKRCWTLALDLAGVIWGIVVFRIIVHGTRF